MEHQGFHYTKYSSLMGTNTLMWFIIASTYSCHLWPSIGLVLWSTDVVVTDLLDQQDKLVLKDFTLV
jgi:hypothetical protein